MFLNKLNTDIAHTCAESICVPRNLYKNVETRRRANRLNAVINGLGLWFYFPFTGIWSQGGK